MADFYDRQDPCQTGQFSEAERQRLNRPVGYQRPNWCGAGQGSRAVIRDANGRFIGTVTTR
jgi:hypothetical protein